MVKVKKKKTTEEQISTIVFGFLLKLPENKKKHEEQDKDKPNQTMAKFETNRQKNERL